MRVLLLFFLFFNLLGCTSNKVPSEKSLSSSNYERINSIEKINTSAPKKLSASEQNKKVILNVPIIAQTPELKYGCEVTSLAMVLQYAGIKVNKQELASRIKKDNDPLIIGKSGEILQWGNPKHGFVGDMTGKNKGFAVYVQPLQQLMEQYLPGQTLNFTHKPFDEVLAQIKNGKPVVVWTTGSFSPPKNWTSWRHGNEQIKTTFDLHAVVLVGYDSGFVYLNDPLRVKKAVKVNKQVFIQSWNALGQQALSYF